MRYSLKPAELRATIEESELKQILFTYANENAKPGWHLDTLELLFEVDKAEGFSATLIYVRDTPEQIDP